MSISSVAPVNQGVADLLQILSNAGSSSLSSAFSSPSIQSALQGASPGDIVQLSNQALQLQVANDLFANPDPTQTDGLFSALVPSTSTAALDSLLTNLYSPPSTASPVVPAAPASLTSQIATYQSQLQTEQLQALFGVDPTVGTSGTLLNVVA
jgi:hypothetical protein